MRIYTYTYICINQHFFLSKKKTEIFISTVARTYSKDSVTGVTVCPETVSK